MLQQPITYDYGEMGRDGLISGEGREEWDWIRWNLDDLRYFLTTVEGFIEEQESREIAEVVSRQPVPIDWSEHDPWYWQGIIGTQLRQSYIVALMSATEWHLDCVCQSVRALIKKPLPSFKNGYEFLKEMPKFLRTAAEFSTPSDDTWDFVNHLRTCRNVLVHRTGVLEGYKWAAEVEKLKGAPGLELDSGLVKIGPEFCPFAHERIDRFFEELRQEFVRLCRRLA